MYAFAQPSPAPGRESGNAATTQPSTPAPGDAGAPQQGPFGGMGMILVMALPLLLLVFMTRSQSKKQKELEASLKVGDRVVTQAGLIGELIDMDEKVAKVKIAPGTTVQVLVTALSPFSTESKADEKSKELADLKEAKADAKK